MFEATPHPKTIYDPKSALDSNPFSAEHANTGNGLSSHCPQSAF